MMELTADQQLIFHWIPILLGILLMSPFGEGIGKSLSSRWPSLETQRGRTLGGSLLVMFGGFTVSTHTLWIHNKAKEIGGGNFCAGDGVWDCSSVIGNDVSKNDESFENGLLEYPQYTKPQIWEKKSVPEVLLSGDHAKIKGWRLSQSEAITRRQRPDLWEKYINKKKNEKY